MQTDKSINQLVSQYLSDLDVKPQTRYNYEKKLDQWFLYLGIKKVNVREPRKADVINYKAYLLAKEMTSTTIDGYLCAVRMFYGWLATNRIYREVYQGEFVNIASGVHSPKKYKGFQKGILSTDQVIELLKAMPKDTISEMRDWCIVNFMLRTGVRRCELHRLNVGDLICEGAHWSMKIMRKGHQFKDQIIGISDKATDPLYEYILLCDNAKNPDSPVLINHSKYNTNERLNIDYISSLIKKSLRTIGIDDPKFTGHSLRHTSAVMALRAGASIYEVQKMLGHSSTDTTQIYLSAFEAESFYQNPAVSAIDVALEKQTKTSLN
ncbi:MAG: hypothetical protein C0397_02500 [Odoribacter sp.]|nr:hypothetical protein [Odoribacter sp.]